MGSICGCWGRGDGCGEGGGGGGGWDLWVWSSISSSSLLSENEELSRACDAARWACQDGIDPHWVVLEGELWGALVGIPVVSNIVHLMLHGSKIIESHGNQW